MSFATFVFLVIAAVVVLLILTGARNRPAAPGPPRNCPRCASQHPHFAKFCRRCGNPLG
jgi:predicted amidophosphoribosyltransferase